MTGRDGHMQLDGQVSGDQMAGGERELLRCDARVKWFFALLLLYLALTTALKIHGSSIGMWAYTRAQETVEEPVFGTPRYIKSDEYFLHTPAILSQCHTTPEFPVENYALGGERAPLIMNLPVRHFSTLLRPQQWLFFFADTERAFAFYWNMKGVLLVSGLFVLLLLLLKNNFTLAVAGALWAYFSAYTQWWYSSPHMCETIGAFALATTACLVMLLSGRRRSIVVAALVFVVAAFNFAISLYPPHQVPLAYLGFAIVLGTLWPRRRAVWRDLATNWFRLACLAFALALSAILVLLWLRDAWPTLEALSSTVYPGDRRVAGGDFSLGHLFNGYLGFYLDESNVPPAWYNICEAGNYMLLFPAVMLLMGWKWFAGRSVSNLEVALLAFILGLVYWQVVGFPQVINRILLLDRAAEIRALLPLGIASILLTCLSLQELREEKLVCSRRAVAVVSLGMGLLVLVYGLGVTRGAGNLLSAGQLAVLCSYFGGLAMLLASRKQLAFSLLVVLPNLYFFGLTNPIARGLQPLLGHPVFRMFREMVVKAPEAKYIIFNDDQDPFNTCSLLAIAAGAKVFDGFKYVPNRSELAKLSVADRDVQVYNRYGYLTLLPEQGEEMAFLYKQDDSYELHANPEDRRWNALGIKYACFKSGNSIGCFNSPAASR